jgi:hypothetical protein
MSVAPESPWLDEQARARLAALADALVPGGLGLPSASGADVSGRWIERTLAANPDLTEAVVHALTLPGKPAQSLDQLRVQDPVAFESFAFAVSAAYFMNPRVRRALGYPGNAPRRQPAAEGEAEYYLEDDVLAPVVERGAIYRGVSDPA